MVSVVAASQLRHLLRVARRGEPRQALVAHRRQREAADHLDDAIEFEGPQNSRLHKVGNP